MDKVLGVIPYLAVAFFCNISLWTLEIVVVIVIFLLGLIVIRSFRTKGFVELLHIVDDEGGWCGIKIQFRKWVDS